MRKKNRKCIDWIYGKREYLDRLDKLIQDNETAKLAYEEKNATRKAKAMESNGSRLRLFCCVKKICLPSVIARVKAIKLCRRD